MWIINKSGKYYSVAKQGVERCDSNLASWLCFHLGFKGNIWSLVVVVSDLALFLQDFHL